MPTGNSSNQTCDQTCGPTVAVDRGKTHGRYSTEYRGYWYGGAVARTAPEISAVPDLPLPLPAVVREGKLERILRVLAGELHARENLQLEEALIDASL
jgi:hypothetical protein